MMKISLMLVAGLAALYLGAGWLVRLAVTPLLVGLPAMAYGTSTPGLIVSSLAAANGQAPIANSIHNPKRS